MQNFFVKVAVGVAIVVTSQVVLAQLRKKGWV